MSDRTQTDESPETGSRSSRSLSLTTGAVTLLGVALSVGVTVGFGLSGSWWLRVTAGCLTTVGLLAAIKLTTQAGRGPLARFAHWIIGAPEEK